MAWTLYGIEIDTMAVALASGKAIAALILKKVADKMTTKVCKIKTCQRLAAAENCRGLCMMCYSMAKKKVNAGEVTWEKLAEMGLCENKEAADPFSDAYSRATKGE